MTQSPLLLLYATHDGQTAKVVARLKNKLEALDVSVLALHLGETTPSLFLLEEAPFVLVISPIRYGSHLPAVDRFLRAHRDVINPARLGMVSINLTARKPEKNTPLTNPYFRKWLRKHRIVPSLAAVWAGKLDYPRYRWLDRFMIRFIMFLTNGPTDPRTMIDFTPWDQVDTFAQSVAGRCTPVDKKQEVA